MKRALNLALCTLLWFNSLSTFAQSPNPVKEQPTRVLFLVDFSLSMGTRWEKQTKIVVLREALQHAIQILQERYPQVAIGLRLFGHRSPRDWHDCQDTRLEVPIQTGNYDKIRNVLYQYSPRGVTPLAYALLQTPKDFPKTPGRHVVIVLTDGAEACGGNVCDAFRYLRSRGIQIKPFLIGLNLPDEAFGAIACGGVIAMNARHEHELKLYLQRILDRIVALASVDIALLDNQGRPTETDVPLLFFSQEDTSLIWAAFHTLNAYGKPDTFYLDPIYNYAVHIGMFPPIDFPFTLSPGQHTHIERHTPTGTLNLTLTRITLGKDVEGRLQGYIRPFLQRPSLSSPPVNLANAEPRPAFRTIAVGTPLRLRQGKYILTVSTLPILQDTITIDGGHTTRVAIPEPAVLVLFFRLEGAGTLVRHTGKKNFQTVYDLSGLRGRVIFVVQPGTYQLIFRPNTAPHTRETIVHTIELRSGETRSVTLP